MGQVYEIINSPNVYRTQKAEYEGNKKIQQARNTKEAALAMLKNFQVSETNNRKMAAAGKEYNDQVVNLGKGLNSTIGTKLNFQLAASNLQGQMAAQAGAAGVGGSAVDLMDQLTNLQTDVQLQATSDERNSLSIFGSRSNAQIIDNAIMAMDNSQHFGNFDYSQQVTPKPLKNRWGAVIGVAVATYFGGPEAGKAAADTVLANWKSKQGDYASAAKYFSNAADSAANAYKEWQSVQDGETTKSWWSAVRDRNNASKKAASDAGAKSVNAGSLANFGSEDASSMGGWWGGF